MVSVHGACLLPYDFGKIWKGGHLIDKTTNFFKGYIQNWDPAIGTMKVFDHENQPFEIQQKKMRMFRSNQPHLLYIQDELHSVLSKNA